MRSKAALLLLIVSVAVSSCSGGEKSAAPTPSPTASPTASPTPSPLPTGDPLTGGVLVKGPVVAVKVDNGGLARPYQRGLRQAAIVYQELVEGGSTRFMAIFESANATSEVGPIRSARESDIDVLRAFGSPALAFSGANSGVMAIVRQAARDGYLEDASYNAVPSLYRLGERRRDARNFFAVPSRIGARVHGSEPRDIGWRFGPVGQGLAATKASVPFSSGNSTQVAYDAATGTFKISQAGRLVPVSPANVIIQRVRTRPSRFYDVHGQNTPFTITTGTGTAIVMRDGQRFLTNWIRTGFGPTRFVDADGNDVLLKPGPTWVMLEPLKQKATFS